MKYKERSYKKIDKIAKELGLVKTRDDGVYCLRKSSPTIIDLTASANDFKSVAKNIIRQV